MDTSRDSSHSAFAFLAGLILGIAAGIFIQSERGQEIQDDTLRMAQRLQRRIMRKLGTVKDLTRETYEKMVDEVLDRYARTRDVAAEELKELKERLLEQGEEIRLRLKEDREDPERT